MLNLKKRKRELGELQAGGGSQFVRPMSRIGIHNAMGVQLISELQMLRYVVMD